MIRNGLEKRVAAIEARNRKVELDKAWETSIARKVVLFVATFLLTYIFLRLIDENYPAGNAVLASIGFVLSASTISYLKNYWIARQ